MSDKDLVIDLEDDTEGHGYGLRIVDSDDADWLEDRLRKDSGKSRFRISLGDEDDTEGHGGGAGSTLRLNLADEDDTEGHAIAIHFPSLAEADAFRRRLLVSGVLVGTVALGAAGGIGLSALQSEAGSADAGSAAVTQAGQDWEAQRQAQAGYTDPVVQSGQDWEAQRQAQSGTDPVVQSGQDWEAQRQAQSAGASSAATQTGPMDAHEAPAFQNAGLSDADQAYADRLSGQAAAAQTGPMDAHEAPAFQNAGLSDADQAYADRLSGQAAAAQTGPMDAHEAPAFQQSSAATSVDADSDIGIMDGSNAGASDSDSSPDLKGPAPR